MMHFFTTTISTHQLNQLPVLCMYIIRAYLKGALCTVYAHEHAQYSKFCFSAVEFHFGFQRIKIVSLERIAHGFIEAAQRTFNTYEKHTQSLKPISVCLACSSCCMKVSVLMSKPWHCL